MGKVFVGLNTEFSRSSDKPFEWAVEETAKMGFEYIEPMVHFGRELMSEAGYYATVSMLDDPLRVKRTCEKAGVKLSGLSAHTPMCKPDISLNYLKQAIRFAAECGAPCVNSDEGPKPPWTTEEEDHVLMKYVLTEAAAVAEDEIHELAGLDGSVEVEVRLLERSPATGVGGGLKGALAVHGDGEGRPVAPRQEVPDHPAHVDQPAGRRTHHPARDHVGTRRVPASRLKLELVVARLRPVDRIVLPTGVGHEGRRQCRGNAPPVVPGRVPPGAPASHRAPGEAGQLCIR